MLPLSAVRSRKFSLDAREWRLVGIALGAAFLLWLVVMLAIRPRYEAVMLVGPTPSSNRGGLSSLSSLTSLLPSSAASLLGSSALTSSGANDYQSFRQLLSSEEVAQKLLAIPGFKETVLRRQWDFQQNRFKRGTGVVARVNRLLNGAVGIQDTDTDRSLLADFLDRSVTDTPVAITGFDRITAVHRDPQGARELLADVYRAADSLLREKREARVQSYLNYLRHKLDMTTNDAERTALISLVVDQDRELMILQSGQPFAAELMRAPALERMPVAPHPLEYLVIALAGGLAAAGFTIYRRRRRAGTN